MISTALKTPTATARLGLAAALLALAGWALRAQPGFNIALDLGLTNNTFFDLMVHDDTIVGLGVFRADTANFQQGILVAKLDSSGQLLAYNTLLDHQGSSFSIGETWGKIAKVPGDGYVFTTATLGRRDAILFKLDDGLQEEFRYEYDDVESRSNFNYQAPIPLADGYLLYGRIQQLDYKNKGFARRVDRQGNTLWFRQYGSDGISTSYLDGALLGDSVLLAGGMRSLSQPGQSISYTIFERIRVADGELLHSWQSPVNPAIGWFRHLAPMEEGDVMAFGMRLLEQLPNNTYIVQPVASRLSGDNYSPKWMLPFGLAYTLNAGIRFNRLAQSADGHFVGAGRTLNWESGWAYTAGWAFKFTADGDSLWSRTFLPELPLATVNASYFGGFGELSSGSLVAGGMTADGPYAFGWVLKMGPDGCTGLEEEGPCATPSAQALVPAAAPGSLLAWPNPASGQFWAQWDGPPTPRARFELHDAKGRLQWSVERALPSAGPFSLEGLPAGLYFFTLVLPDGQRYAQKIVVQ